MIINEKDLIIDVYTVSNRMERDYSVVIYHVPTGKTVSSININVVKARTNALNELKDILECNKI